jgi:hypothetical protein
MLVTMTYELAMAAGQTAADIQMRKAGRTKWNVDDRNRAAEVFWKCYGKHVIEKGKED